MLLDLIFQVLFTVLVVLYIAFWIYFTVHWFWFLYMKYWINRDNLTQLEIKEFNVGIIWFIWVCVSGIIFSVYVNSVFRSW